MALETLYIIDRYSMELKRFARLAGLVRQGCLKKASSAANAAGLSKQGVGAVSASPHGCNLSVLALDI